MTEGQEGTFKRTLFQWSDDDKATWSGFTSVDGCCQSFNGVCSWNMLVKELSDWPDPVSMLRMCCFSPIIVGCNMSFKIKKKKWCSCVWHPDPVRCLCKPVCLSRSVVETCPALSLMVLCSTCRLKGRRSTAPEADSHKQKLCVYWHQATTSLSLVGGGRSGGYRIGPSR